MSSSVSDEPWPRSEQLDGRVLFAGSDEGAANWAMLASLIETCNLHAVNPQAYLTDVLTKLVNNWPNSRLTELTPWGWAAEIH